ncbi:2OG-Fe(II) oxygenase [Gloeobacter violaceus]|uniref:2OG-Fe(II) oxygenase n=1 Tax=Gloeobacter violaceus TaxID=33072 RepID=UPI0013E8CD0C|nr:2OG-Fe(II) oxygenase [Gloeobacter violaceus]
MRTSANGSGVGYYRLQPRAFSPVYLTDLAGQILASPYLAINNLNRDFVATRGFSVVFTRAGLATVRRRFPFFGSYLDLALVEECNAFYLNPLLLEENSRVDPHIDRSLRSYCKTIEPPFAVSVLYVQVPTDLEGGELVLSRARRPVGRIRPEINLLVHFQGDLTHAVERMRVCGRRLSLVCEQYQLDEEQLAQIPEFVIESRAAVRRGGY